MFRQHSIAKFLFHVLVIMCFLFLLNFSLAHAEDVEVPAQYVVPIISAQPDQHFPAVPSVRVGQTPATGNVSMALFKFDLSVIPQGAQINTARLRIYFSGVYGIDFVPLQGQFNFSILQITEDWDSETVTWNTQQGVVLGRVATASLNSNNRGYQPWDITDLVQRWVEDPDADPNYGLKLFLESPTDRHAYGTFWGPQATSNHPVINISYEPGEEILRVSEINVRNVQAESVEVSWQTDVPTRGAVLYGENVEEEEDADLEGVVETPEQWATASRVSIFNLKPCTEYFFWIYAVDASDSEYYSPEVMFFRTLCPGEEEPEEPPALEEEAVVQEEGEEAPILESTPVPVTQTTPAVVTPKTPTPTPPSDSPLPPKPAETPKLEIQEKPYFWTENDTEYITSAIPEWTPQEREAAVKQLLAVRQESSSPLPEDEDTVPAVSAPQWLLKQPAVCLPLNAWFFVLPCAAFLLLYFVLVLMKMQTPIRPLLLVCFVLFAIFSLYTLLCSLETRKTILPSPQVAEPPSPAQPTKSEERLLVENTIYDATYSKIYDFIALFVPEEVVIQEGIAGAAQKLPSAEALARIKGYIESTTAFWDFNEELEGIKTIRASDPENFPEAVIGVTNEGAALIFMINAENLIWKVIYLPDYRLEDKI